MPETSVVLDSSVPKEVAIAGTLIPYSRDDEKAKYLGYLACGFSVREALHMIERSKPWLSACRHDPVFVDLENRVPEFRKELAKEYVEIEFFRNFRLALEKDYRILKKSLNPDKRAVYNEDGHIVGTEDAPMPRQDHDYLIKLRSQYNPQQLQILEAIVSGTDSGFNFAAWVSQNQDVIQMSRTDSVTVRKGSGSQT